MRIKILFIILLLCGTAHATTIVDETFDDQAYVSPLTFYNSCDPYEGYNVGITYSSSIARGGTGYSLIGSHIGGDISGHLTNIENYYNGGIYIRYYVYYPSSYSWPGETGVFDNVKMAKFAGDIGWDIELIYKNTSASGPTLLQLYWNTQSTGSTVGYYASLGSNLEPDAWHKIEIYVSIPDSGNSTIHVTVDDYNVFYSTNADIRRSDSDYTGTRQFISIRASNEPPSGQGTFYIDDIYIVAGEGDLTGGATPTPTPTPGPDTTAPTVTITNSDPDTTETTSIPVAWTSYDAVGVTGCKWLFNAQPGVDTGTTATSPTTITGLSDGDNLIYVGCYDAAGNWGYDSFTVVSGAGSFIAGTALGRNTSDDVATGSDTYCNSSYGGDDNYSSELTLNTYLYPLDTSANTIILKFDTSSLSGTVTAARLYLYINSAGGTTDPLTITAQKLTGHDPTIASATWLTYNGTDEWTEMNGGQSDAAASEDSAAASTSGWVYWDIPIMVQSWIDTPASNYGVLLNATTGAAYSYRFFHSSESTDGFRPKLIVQTESSVIGAPAGLRQANGAQKTIQANGAAEWMP